MGTRWRWRQRPGTEHERRTKLVQNSVAVLYATAQTVAALSGTTGYTQLDSVFRRLNGCRPPDRDDDSALPGDVRASPVQRPAGDPIPWRLAGQEHVQQHHRRPLRGHAARPGRRAGAASSTISTLVSEQTPEIATMKAIGARRRQIRRVYLRTAALLGGLGAGRRRGARAPALCGRSRRISPPRCMRSAPR